MPKVIILPLSFCVDTKPQNSVDAFSKLGVSKFMMVRHWLTLDKIFNRYRKGELTTLEFKREIAKVTPIVNQLSDEQFDSAWNVQCQVTQSTRAKFKEIERLIKEGLEVYFLSGTNALHISHIEKQYGKTIPGKGYWSFQHKKIGKDLLTRLLTQIHHENTLSQQDVALFYAQPSPPPYPRLGLLSWLLAPFGNWFHRQAVQYVTSLEKESRQHQQFRLVDCKLSELGSITKAVNELGWIAAKPVAIKQNKGYFLREKPKQVERFGVPDQSIQPQKKSRKSI